MTPVALGAIVETVGKVIDDLHTSDKERMEMDIKGREVDQRVDLAQIGVNTEEAKHSSLFVAGWRPAVGWVCVAALAYQFLLYPLLTWLWASMQAAGWIIATLPHPPLLDLEALLIVLGGILGLGALRTAEKIKHVAR